MDDNLEWRISSFSDNSGPYCAEVAVNRLTGTRYVRNSKAPEAGTVAFTPPEWVAFVRGVKAGEFDD